MSSRPRPVHGGDGGTSRRMPVPWIRELYRCRYPRRMSRLSPCHRRATRAWVWTASTCSIFRCRMQRLRKFARTIRRLRSGLSCMSTESKSPTAIMNSGMPQSCAGECGGTSIRGPGRGDPRRKSTNGCSRPTSRDYPLARGSQSDLIGSSCSPADTARCATSSRSRRTSRNSADGTLRATPCRS